MEGYQISEDDKTKIRETFDVTESEVKVRIKLLQKWAKDLPHLPQESQGNKIIAHLPQTCDQFQRKHFWKSCYCAVNSKMSLSNPT
jgi:hypothetical protein